jgi:hypothetical protein
MTAQALPALHGLRLAVAVTDDSVQVRGDATVDAVFGRALPGFGDRHISSTADATLSAGGATVAPGSFGPAAGIYCA